METTQSTARRILRAREIDEEEKARKKRIDRSIAVSTGSGSSTEVTTLAQPVRVSEREVIADDISIAAKQEFGEELSLQEEALLSERTRVPMMKTNDDLARQQAAAQQGLGLTRDYRDLLAQDSLDREIAQIKKAIEDATKVAGAKEKAFVKHDQDKPRFDLIPPEVELEVAKVFTYGAKKYSPDNYRLGTEWSRYIAACRRHLNAWQRGEDLDPETGFSHLAHAIASLMMLLTIQLTSKGTDDRAKQ